MRIYKYKGKNKEYKYVSEYVKDGIIYYRAQVEEFYKDPKKFTGKRKREIIYGRVKDTAKAAALDVDIILLNIKKTPVNILVGRPIT